MAKKSNPLQAALDAAKIKASVDDLQLDDDAMACSINGVYDYIQRQGRSDDDLIALAVQSYIKHIERTA